MRRSAGPAFSRPYANDAAKSTPVESINATGTPVEASSSSAPSFVPGTQRP